MISFPGTHTPRNPTKYHLAAGKKKMCIPTPVQAGGLKLEKLKKLWSRRVKPIITAGAGRNSTSRVHRRRIVVTDMIGFPQDFTHSKHVGMHEISQAEPHLGKSNDVPHTSLLNPEEWSSLGRLYQSEFGTALDITHEDHAVPFISAQHNARHSLCSSPIPARTSLRKVKRKSVPIDACLQEMIDSSPREVNTAPTHETDCRRHSRVSIEESVLQFINYEQPQKQQDNQVELPI